VIRVSDRGGLIVESLPRLAVSIGHGFRNRFIAVFTEGQNFYGCVHGVEDTFADSYDQLIDHGWKFRISIGRKYVICKAFGLLDFALESPFPLPSGGEVALCCRAAETRD